MKRQGREQADREEYPEK